MFRQCQVVSVFYYLFFKTIANPKRVGKAIKPQSYIKPSCCA